MVATVLFGVPPTQATVERTFSVVGFIFNNRRFKLSQSMLESIMLTKMNKDLAEEIFKADVEELDISHNSNDLSVYANHQINKHIFNILSI